MKLDDLSREELYEKVWSKSGIKLSAEFGISDVAITKRCRKLNIPRPPRGYWAKIEAGQRPKRSPLPPASEQALIRKVREFKDQSLMLPDDSAPLHALAAEFLKAAQSASLSYDKKRIHLRERSVPEAEVSKGMVLRSAQAFHVLLQVVEPLGIHFRRSQSSYDGGHFRKGNDYLHFKIEELLVAKPETGARRRTYYTNSQENTVPCGFLTFSLKTSRYGSSGPTTWEENDKNPLEKVLAEMAKFICNHYMEAQKRREAEAIERAKQRVESERRHQEYLLAEEIRRSKEAAEKHAKALELASQQRREDLVKAAEWWRLHQSVAGFIAECEQRWLLAQEGKLTDEQKDWMTWARAEAGALSPFETGYPDPLADGGFDPASVAFGGPYPATREFPHPPTMPQIPAPEVIKSGYDSSSFQPQPQSPYPFWLKHPRH
jgi:hypothetical protein